MKNTPAAEYLFVRAGKLLNEVFELLDEYNSVAYALEEMGYALPHENSAYPVPTLVLSSGCMDYEDAGFLDEFREIGPTQKPKGEVCSSRQFAVRVERNRLGAASGWTCFYCGSRGTDKFGPDARGWHVDHAFPVVRGGDGQPSNLVLACATCNLEKKDRSAVEYFQSKLIAKQ